MLSDKYEVWLRDKYEVCFWISGHITLVGSSEHINRDAGTREKNATCKSILVARTARKTQKIGTGLLSEINLDLHGNNVRRLAAYIT